MTPAVLRKFILIDAALEGMGGHYSDYAERVLGEAEKVGFETFLVTRNDISNDVTNGRRNLSLLRRDFWSDFVVTAGSGASLNLEARGLAAGLRDRLGLGLPGPGAARQMLRRAALALFMPAALVEAALRRLTTAPLRRAAKSFAEDLARVDDAVGGLGAGDVVFMPTIFVAEALGLARFLSARPAARATAWRLLYRRDLDIEQNSDEATLKRRRGRLARALDAIATLPDIRLFTDTEALSRQYSEMSSTRFFTAPIPVDAGRRAAPTARRPLNVTFLGDARCEKGFHLLPGLIDRVPPGEAVRYAVQANFSAGDGEPPCVAAREALAGRAGVELLVGPFSREDYAALLAEADVVVLPYDAKAYRARSSGIFVEALANGTPVVVTAGTWMSAQLQAISKSGPAVGTIAGTGSEALAEGVRQVIEQYADYRAAALGHAAAWKDHHSSHALFTTIMASAMNDAD